MWGISQFKNFTECVFTAIVDKYLLKCARCVEEELKLRKVEWVFQGPVEHCTMSSLYGRGRSGFAKVLYL